MCSRVNLNACSTNHTTIFFKSYSKMQIVFIGITPFQKVLCILFCVWERNCQIFGNIKISKPIHLSMNVTFVPSSQNQSFSLNCSCSFVVHQFSPISSMGKAQHHGCLDNQKQIARNDQFQSLSLKLVAFRVP